MKTHVCDSQSRQIVPVELASHSLASTRTALPQMRWNVAAVTSTQAASSWSLVVVQIQSRSSSRFVDRCHGVLVGTASSEMLSATDTTLDLLVLELILDATLLALLLSLLRLCLPVHARSENDVLSNGGRVERGSWRMALFQAELGPLSALRNLGVHMFLHNGRLDLAGDLHLLSLVVEAVGDNSLRSILVRNDLLCGEGRGVIELLVVGPVGCAAKMKKFRQQRFAIQTVIISLTLRVWTL